MATLPSLPSPSFIENLPRIKITDVASTIDIDVLLDGKVLVDKITLTANTAAEVTFDLRPIVRGMISLTKPEEVDTPFPQVVVGVRDGDTSTSFTAWLIPGGIARNDLFTPAWFDTNFLTWQPQVIETTPSQPQWLSLVARTANRPHTTLYTLDGRSYTKVLTSSLLQGSHYGQFRTDFQTVWARQCADDRLVPFGYDVFLPVAGGHRQRYILRPGRYNDVCFGFENTLGGFDTLMLSGRRSYQPEGEVTAFENHLSEYELYNDYTSIWEANSGRLETEREAGQFQDFFKSTNRWVLHDGVWQRIIVSEYKIKHVGGEPNTYTFKYHLAERNELRDFARDELSAPELPTAF